MRLACFTCALTLILLLVRPASSFAQPADTSEGAYWYADRPPSLLAFGGLGSNLPGLVWELGGGYRTHEVEADIHFQQGSWYPDRNDTALFQDQGFIRYGSVEFRYYLVPIISCSIQSGVAYAGRHPFVLDYGKGPFTIPGDAAYFPFVGLGAQFRPGWGYLEYQYLFGLANAQLVNYDQKFRYSSICLGLVFDVFTWDK